jgi:hypothetical protein
MMVLVVAFLAECKAAYRMWWVWWVCSQVVGLFLAGCGDIFFIAGCSVDSGMWWVWSRCFWVAAVRST